MPRENVWFDTVVSNASLAEGSGEFEILLPSNFDEFEQFKGMTVVRWLAKLTVLPATPSAALGTQLVTIGLGVVGEEAATVGISSLPNPNIAGNRPPSGWVYRESLIVQDAAGDPASMTWPQFDFDIRSARKLNYGLPVVISQNTDIVGVGFSVRVHGIIRLLLKRP